MENIPWAPTGVCDPAQVSKSWALRGTSPRVAPGQAGMGTEGTVSVWISLCPRPQRDPGAVTALSSGRDPEVLPRCQSHAGLHPGALLEAVLGRHQPGLAGGEHPWPNYGQGHRCPSGHPAGQPLPSHSHEVTKLPGEWAGMWDLMPALPVLLLQPRALPHCPRPQHLTEKGSWKCIFQPFPQLLGKAECSRGCKCSFVSSSQHTASLAGPATGPSPVCWAGSVPLKCQLPRHFKGCRRQRGLISPDQIGRAHV